jgi:hypothetical protein
MRPAGLSVFEARDPKRPGAYSFEQRRAERNAGLKLAPAYEKQFKANAKAWAFFTSRAPYYQRVTSWWVMSAKKEETQLKRLATLIDDSAHGRRIGPMSRPATTAKKPR